MKGMTEAELPPAESGERMAFLWSLPATVELTHNHGSEASEADRVYHPGNNVDGVKGGFGHIGIVSSSHGSSRRRRNRRRKRRRRRRRRRTDVDEEEEE